MEAAEALSGELSYAVLRKPSATARPEYSRVEEAAVSLRSFLQLAETRAAIEAKHVVGGRSTDIQDILSPIAAKLGFMSEKSGLFSKYKTSGLRPDYFLPLESTGVIMEVERGKTLPNNMALLDLWKCHLCAEADYLFLIIPRVRQTRSGGSNKMFEPVVKRLGSFFEPQNYVNVEAVFVFGY